MLTDEQTQKVKNHLLEQLENFPEEQRKIIKHKILSMNNEEMEEFLKENNLNQAQEESPEQKCIFCSIVKKEIKSYIIDEDKDYIAILELNPGSKGHTLIIPKEHYSIDKIPESSVEFAKKVAANISKKLKPKDVQFKKNEVLGHANLEIIPVYGEEKLDRHHATEEELTELFNIIKSNEGIQPKEEKINEEKIPEKPKEEKPEPKKEEIPKLKPRLKWI